MDINRANGQPLPLAGIVDAVRRLSLSETQAWGDLESVNDKAVAAAVALRQAAGERLPFSFDEATLTLSDDSTHWFARTRALDHNLFLCDRYGADNPYLHESLESPQGRHHVFGKMLAEMLAAAKANGWATSKERLLEIVMESSEPTNGKELLLTRFGALLYKAPSEPLSVSSAIALYRTLIDGIDVVLAENDGARREQALRRERVILEEACTALTDPVPEHPIIRALVVYQIVSMLRPFPAANLLMARLLHSWVLYEGGLAPVSAIPIMQELTGWSREEVPNPKDPGGFMIWTVADSYDWTPFFERAVEMYARRLNAFANKFYGFKLHRERLMDLLSCIEDTNERQREVLVEAIVHEDAEFTYAEHRERHAVAYATAHEDLNALKERGYLVEKRQGKQTYFIASDQAYALLHEEARRAAPDTYHKYYSEDGRLSEGFLAQRIEEAKLDRPSFPLCDLLMGAGPVFDPSRASFLIEGDA